MNMLEPQTEPSLVYRQERPPATDDNAATGPRGSAQTGALANHQSGVGRHQPSHTAHLSTRRGGVTSGSGPNQGSRGPGPDQAGAQQQTAASRTTDSIRGSPFETSRQRSSDITSGPSLTGNREHAAESEQSQRGQSRIDDLDIQLGEQSMQLNADVDRLVDVLYRKLERKHRMERQRRGF
ncbi:hypothetical protein ACH9L7_18655 (plasmid) [Haloferax sp. S1W]|uniref:hypothetical protein n=1 Tax=Haloferax sp. S1W TaxID=3377110 RepID=UPI0037C6A4E5